MAYLQTRPQDEEEQIGKPTLSGQSAMVQTGAPASTAPTADAGPGAGTGFVDLRRYLEMNAPKTEGLANKIGEDVEGKAKETELGIDTGKSDFEKSARSLNATDDSWVQGALTKPVETVGDPGALDRFTALRDARYRGPSELETQPFQAGIEGAQSRGKLTENAGGLEELMSGYSTDPTWGKSALNTALLDQSDPAQARLAAARARTQGLNDYLNNAVTASQGVAGDIQGQLKAYAPKVGQMSSDSAAAMKAAIDQAFRNNDFSALQAINQKIEQTNQNIPQSGTNAWTSFVPLRSGTGLSRSQSATTEDYARDAALDQLMGKESGVLANEDAALGGKWQEGLDAILNDPALTDKMLSWQRTPYGKAGGTMFVPLDGSPASPSDADLKNMWRMTPDGQLYYAGPVNGGAGSVTQFYGDFAAGRSGKDPGGYYDWQVVKR